MWAYVGYIMGDGTNLNAIEHMVYALVYVVLLLQPELPWDNIVSDC